MTPVSVFKGLDTTGIRKNKNKNIFGYSPTHTLRCSFSIFNPTWWCKICWFCTIETMIKASVIAIWKSYHNFSFHLCDLKNKWTILSKFKTPPYVHSSHHLSHSLGPIDLIVLCCLDSFLHSILNFNYII